MDEESFHEKRLSDHPLMVQQCNSYLQGEARIGVTRARTVPTPPPPPDLPIALFHSTRDPRHADWASALEEGFDEVREELLTVLANKKRMEQANNAWVGPLAGEQVAQAYGAQWKTLGLFDREEWDEDNMKLFPKVSPGGDVKP